MHSFMGLAVKALSISLQQLLAAMLWVWPITMVYIASHCDILCVEKTRHA